MLVYSLGLMLVSLGQQPVYYERAIEFKVMEIYSGIVMRVAPCHELGYVTSMVNDVPIAVRHSVEPHSRVALTLVELRRCSLEVGYVPITCLLALALGQALTI